MRGTSEDRVPPTVLFLLFAILENFWRVHMNSALATVQALKCEFDRVISDLSITTPAHLQSLPNMGLIILQR